MAAQKTPGYHLKPQALFLATLLTVFLSEIVVMLILDLLPVLPPAGEAFLDACLLSLLVVPCLYFLFLRPFQGNVAGRQRAESEHQKIQAVDRMKSEFISIAAHELRTPLATIMGYSELLLDEDRFDQGQRRDFATIINQKADTMDRLVDDLLDMSRIELGKPLRIEKTRHDIVAVTAGLVDEYRRKHPDRGFAVTLPPAPLAFDFDRVRIEQVLDNLLSNAVKFSPPPSPIDVAGTLRGETFQLAIRDRGIGMTPEQREHVFDKFYRADNSDTSPAGLGLGMAIAREIVALHGGEIRYESRPRHGTTVYVSLPVTPAAQ